MRSLVLHGLVEKSNGRYTGICLELDVATEGRTIPEAKTMLKEAVLGYLRTVVAHGWQKELIPRPAPVEEWLKLSRINAQRKIKKKQTIFSRDIRMEDFVYA